jgi:CRISPR-associated endonuclease Csn1
MQRKMRYRLGLDLGTTSIGWCMTRLDTGGQPYAVIRMGARIFPDGRNPKDGSSLAVTRRQARQMRRRRDRLLKRKHRLINALVRHGFFPSDENERKALVVLDPYVLRKKGLDESLTGPEFARALFHLNQRRGFKSNRKADSKDSDSGALKAAIRDLRRELDDESCRTLGEWLANRHQSKLSVRARLRGKTKKERAYDFYADRAMIEHEFDSLWATQSSLNPSLYTDAARVELKDILLFQRPLRPVVPGRCALIPEESRAPLALPSVQRFRIYQELNNLRIINYDLTQTPLSLGQRDLAAEHLEKSDVTFGVLRKLLRLSGTQFNLEDGKRDRLNGNKTSKILSHKDCFGDAWFSFPAEKQEEIVDKLVSVENESDLVAWLQKETNIDEATAQFISSKSLPDGYGNLSRKAISAILPFLVADVATYSDAVVKAGFESHSALSAFQQTGELLQELPYYGEALKRHVGFGSGHPDDPPELRWGKIANPTVHIGLNELRKVVNELIRRYGHPDEVVIEVARDLKVGRERRLEIQREQKSRQDRNRRLVEEACVALGRDHGSLDRATRRDLAQRMQLWVELNPDDPVNRRCPYSGQQISISRLLSSQVEIEHILPWSRTLDDSLNNKTVVIRQANRDKGNQTPYEAFGRSQIPGYEYEAILERAALMPKAKARRFAPDGYEQWLKGDKSFLARALNDTAYISRISREYLSRICPENKVRVIPGRLTALLRAKFGLNELLSGNDSKTREDHRHHAIDAAVVAITDQALLKRFADANQRAKERQLDKLLDRVPLPWPTYREHVLRALHDICVSHKPDHGYQRAMHEETAWGFANKQGKAVRRERPETGGPRQRIFANKKLVPISSTNDVSRHGLDGDGNPRAYKGYVGGSNYCIEIWRDTNGRWKGDVISTFQAYQVIRELGPEKGEKRLRDQRWTLRGEPLVMRLMINDLVRIGGEHVSKALRVATIRGNGTISLAAHNEANVDARARDADNPFSYISKTAGSLQKAQGRRVVVNPIGDLRDPGFPG